MKRKGIRICLWIPLASWALLSGCGDSEMRHYNRGLSFFERRDTVRAIGEFENVVRINPRNRSAHFNLGMLYNMEGLHQDSIQAFKRVIEIDPDYPKTYYQLALVYHEGLDDGATARAHFRHYLEIDPFGRFASSARAYLGQETASSSPRARAEERIIRAGSLAGRGKPLEAVREYEAALRLNPRDTGLHLKIARLCDEQLGDMEKAVTHYEKYLESHLKAPEAAEIMARIQTAREALHGAGRTEEEAERELQEALKAYRAGRFDQAAKQFRSVLAKNPGQAKAHYYLGCICIQQGRYEEALAALKRVGKTGGTLDTRIRISEAYKGLGDAALGTGKVAAAVSFYKRGIETDPSNAVLYKALGMARLQAGKLKEAEGNFRKARSIDPAVGVDMELARVRLQMARKLIEESRPAEALEELRKARNMAPKISAKRERVAIHLAFANRNLREGKRKAAIGEYKKVLDIDGNSLEALFALGQISLEEGRNVRAAHYFERMVKVDPELPDPYYCLGRIYGQGSGDRQKAVRCLTRFVDLSKDTRKRREAEKLLRRFERKSKDALRYRKAVEVSPQSDQAHYNLAVVYQNQKDYDRSIAAYEKSLSLNPKNFRAHYNLGVIYTHLRQWEKAVAHYRKGLSVNPRHAKSYNNLGVVYKEMGLYKKSLREFEKAIRADPSYAGAHLRLANLYGIYFNDSGKALYYAQRYLELAPRGPSAEKVRQWMRQFSG